MTDTTATVGWDFKNGIYQTAQTALSSTSLVVLGSPDDYEATEIVSIGKVRIDESEATLGNTRGRDETLECEVTFSIVGAGFQEGQFDVEQRAWARIHTLEEAVHYITNGVDGTTLGSAVQWCFLTRVEETASGMTTQGRAVELTATFTAFARIRGF